MLVAHHIIDILRAYARGDYTNVVALPGMVPELGSRTADAISKADKFDFGVLPLEFRADDSGNHNDPNNLGTKGVYTLPELSKDEIGFWVDGLIPLPGPACWYEWTLGGTRSGFLIFEQDADSWAIERIDFTKPKIVYHQIFVETSRSKTAGGISDATFYMEAVGNRVFLEKIISNEVFRNHNLGANVPLAVYLTLMINSKSTEVSPAPAPPPKLNKKRMRAGKEPLAEHRIVNIVPARFQKAAEDEVRGTHRPPRLHWRRSHKRHYDRHTLNSRWAPTEVHAGKTGWWVAVIPRMLVGRADLGEVSHEYRVSQGETSPESLDVGVADGLQSRPAAGGVALNGERR